MKLFSPKTEVNFPSIPISESNIFGKNIWHCEKNKFILIWRFKTSAHFSSILIIVKKKLELKKKMSVKS